MFFENVTFMWNDEILNDKADVAATLTEEQRSF